MSLKNPRDLEKLREIGRIVRLTLDRTAEAVRPGVTTAELDAIGARLLADQGAEPAPPKVYKFPGALCISVNDEAIHGVPGGRVVREGDLVKLDCVASKDGYYADAAITVRVGKVSSEADALVRCAESAFREAIKVARTGYRVSDIGRAVERETQSYGFRVIRELCGHGVGASIHEEPEVPNYYDARHKTRLTEGLVITIEPIIAMGNAKPVLQRDKWTIKTADGGLSAHYEHTLVITNRDPILVTAA